MTASPLTPLAVQNIALLQMLAGAKHSTIAGLARAFDRDAANLRKSLKALEAAGLLVEGGEAAVPPLTELGREALAAWDRAHGAGEAAATADAPYLRLRHDQIAPDPDNARKHFDEDALADLADSIAAHGLKQKLSVRGEAIDGRHMLTMGERRWRAWGLLIADARWAPDHLEPCWIDEAADAAARAEGGLIENLQREDLNHAEIGEAFETLATTHGRSNKQIAERVGCTPEYVQQHRRLLKLEPAALDEVRAGDLSLHDALRVLATDPPAALTPRQLLIVAEYAHKAQVAPNKRYVGYTEVDGQVAATDGDLSALIKANVLSLTKEDWQDHRAYVSRSWGGRETVQAVEAKLAGDEAAEYLDGVRRAACREANVEAAAAEGRYVTPWLNGPFELTESAQAAIAADKARRQRDKDTAAAEKLARAERLTATQALDAELRQTVLVPVHDRLPVALAEAGISLPLQLKGGQVVGADGGDVFNCHWGFGERGEAINLLLATVINAATGYGAASTPTGDAGDEEGETPAYLSRLAGAAPATQAAE